MYISFSCLSKAVVPLLSFLCALFYELCDLFYEAICFVLPGVVLFLCFQSFDIANTLLGDERAYLSAFHTFV